MSAHPIRIAVDIGGTFTDLQILDTASGRAGAFKTPTTPEDPSIGLIEGIRGAAERFGFAPRDVGLILHGTTIATNAVLERKLPRTALITTAGFEDVLEIGRHMRREIYRLVAEPRALLVPRRLRFGVPERIRADGAVETPLDEDALAALARRLADAEVRAVALTFLHAYANGAHERRARDLLGELLPDVAVSISSDVSPELREFERTSTTVLNAVLMPVVRAYLGRIERRLAEAEVPARLYLVQSNGGVATPVQAAEQPVKLLLSGPSGGAMAVERLASALDLPNVVAIDMGGTSSDVSVALDGRIALVTEGEIDGLPVRVPMVEMRTIGAGGGSIARVGASGALRVGPESAGAEPGPVAYGRGGSEPTVTDANVALGRLDPAFFLGGSIRLDAEAVRDALSRRVAEPLGLAFERAAEGIVAVANAAMAGAIRLSLFEKGADPRDFALIAFGGAGGLHAAQLAEELGVSTVVFPADSATLSARGILFADIVHDFAQSQLMPLDAASGAAIEAVAADLRRRGEEALTRDGIAEADRAYALSADLRYRGQAYELPTPWGDAGFDASGIRALTERFHELHRRRYAYADAEAGMELVTLRITATGVLPKPQIVAEAAAGGEPAKARRAILIDGAWVDFPVLARERLGPGAALVGPALIEEAYTTLLLPAGWHAEMTEAGDIVARRGGSAS